MTLTNCKFYLLLAFLICSNWIYSLQANQNIVYNISDYTDCEDCFRNCTYLKDVVECECLEGYELDLVDNKCKSGFPTVLLYTNRRTIERFSVDNNETIKTLPTEKYIHSFDFSYKDKSLYWSGYSSSFYKSKIEENQTNPEGIPHKYKTGIDVIAYDWIYDHLYWIDNARDKMYVSNANGSHIFTLLQQDFDVSSMAIDPNEGWIFWSNEAFDGRIESSHLDGTAHHITASQNVTVPTCLTLDLIEKRVYWVDSRHNTISFCDYNGTNRNLLITLKKGSYPSSVTTFENWIYYAQSNDFVYRLHKTISDDQKPPILIMSEVEDISIRKIAIYHPLRQPKGENHCTAAKNPCSHLCFPNHPIGSSISYVCKCSNGYSLQQDGKTCVEHDKKVHTAEIIVAVIGTVILIAIMALAYFYRNILCKINYSGTLKYKSNVNEEEVEEPTYDTRGEFAPNNE